MSSNHLWWWLRNYSPCNRFLLCTLEERVPSIAPRTPTNSLVLHCFTLSIHPTRVWITRGDTLPQMTFLKNWTLMVINTLRPTSRYGIWFRMSSRNTSANCCPHRIHCALRVWTTGAGNTGINLAIGLYIRYHSHQDEDGEGYRRRRGYHVGCVSDDVEEIPPWLKGKSRDSGAWSVLFLKFHTKTRKSHGH